MEFTLEEIIEAQGNNLIEVLGTGPKDCCFSISTDSRSLKSEDLFLPLKGENFNGHRFIVDACKKNIPGYFFSELLSVEETQSIKETPLWAIHVKDSLAVLELMGKYIRQRSKAKFIAVTGSNGKTTTKEILGQVLSRFGKTTYSKKSFNNHIGVPLTLLEVEKDTEFVVVEMGTNHLGELKYLSEIVCPHLAIILNVSNAHLGNFGSFEALLKGKAEILEGVIEKEQVVLNETLRESQPFSQMKNKEVFYFGRQNKNEENLSYKVFSSGIEGVKASFSGETSKYEGVFPIIGEHFAENIGASFLALELLGLPLDKVGPLIEKVDFPKMRMEKIELVRGATVLNDAYNGNPRSFQEAIHVLDSLSGFKSKYLVLGEMLELGDFAETFHKELGNKILSKKFSRVFLFGALTKHLFNVIQGHIPSSYYEDIELLAEEINKTLEEGDILLLKGSRGNRLERIIPVLKEVPANV